MNLPNRIVIQRQTPSGEWVVRDSFGGEEVQIGRAVNIRQATELAADFVQATTRQKMSEERRHKDESKSGDDSN
jgi:hypothetical protein